MLGPPHLSGDEVRAQGGSSLAKEKEYERRNAMKTYVILPDLHVEVDPPHKVCVRYIFSHNPYKEKVRYFKTAHGSDISLQRLREIQLKLIKERDGIAEEESE